MEADHCITPEELEELEVETEAWWAELEEVRRLATAALDALHRTGSIRREGFDLLGAGDADPVELLGIAADTTHELHRAGGAVRAILARLASLSSGRSPAEPIQALVESPRARA